jgi:hypothetical protein
VTQVKFIRMVDRVVVEKGETNEEGFALMQAAHPGEYPDDKPLAPIQRAHSMHVKRAMENTPKRASKSGKVGARERRSGK